MKPILLALAIGLSTVTGCASMEPKPCTAEWVDWKKDKILRSFAVENRSLLNRFRKLANAEGDINPLQLVSLMQDTKKIERFATSFTDEVVPQLEDAFQQCGQSEELIPALAVFLIDQGVNEEAVETIAPLMIAAMEIQRSRAPTDTPGT